MPKDNPKTEPGLWMSETFFNEQLSDLKELQTMLQFSIKGAVDDDSGWGKKGPLMMMFASLKNCMCQLPNDAKIVKIRPIEGRIMGMF